MNPPLNEGAKQRARSKVQDTRPNLMDALESLPPDMEVSYPAGHLRALIKQEIRTRMGLDAIEWVGINEADEHLPAAPRSIRRHAKRWKARMEAGERPPVRVRKKSQEKENSDWQFARQDLLRLARHHQETDQTKPATQLPDTGDLDEFLEVA